MTRCTPMTMEIPIWISHLAFTKLNPTGDEQRLWQCVTYRDVRGTQMDGGIFGTTFSDKLLEGSYRYSNNWLVTIVTQCYI